MADGFARRAIRRLVPRRIRQLIRFPYRVLTGYYLRAAKNRLTGLEHTLHLHVEQTDAHSEIMDFFLRRLHTLEEETVAQWEPLKALERQTAHIAETLSRLDRQPVPSEQVAGETARSSREEASGAPSEQPGANDQPLSLAIVCRSLGRRCGIAEYSMLLAERLGAVAVNSVADVPVNADVVFIEYEHTLYDHPMDIVREVDLLRPSTPAIVDAHTITRETFDELQWHAIVGVKRRTLDAAGALRLSLIQPTPVAESGPSRNGLRLGSFGFAFPHKRYEDVIELSRRLGVGATILASPNDSTPEASAVSSEYIRRLKSLEGDGVEVIEDYLPMDEVLARLRECSHLLSCMEDNGAQSASMRTMAAAGRPLIALRSQQAEEIGAIQVDDLRIITREFLLEHQRIAEPYDGIADYYTLIQRLSEAKQLSRRLRLDDLVYQSQPQSEKLKWLRGNIVGRAVVVGSGSGFTTNALRATAGVERDAEKLAYASLRYPHLEFHLLDPRVQKLPGFDTVVVSDVLESMPLPDAAAMVRCWAESWPELILATLAASPLSGGPPPAWEASPQSISRLVPPGYALTIDHATHSKYYMASMRRT